MSGGDGGILVIGGGVVGACSAYYLADRGFKVTLVERAEICPVEGGTYGNAGLIVPSDVFPLPAPGVLGSSAKWLLDSTSPFYVRPRLNPALMRWLLLFAAACTEKKVAASAPVLHDLGKASARLHAELAAADSPGYGYQATGWLSLYTTKSVFERAASRTDNVERFGIAVEVLDAKQVSDVVPGVASDIAGGILKRGDAHLIPDQFVHAVAQLAASRGATIMPFTEVLDIAATGSRVTRVDTTKGVLRPDTVVLAAGAWSRAIAARLGLSLLIEPAKGYSVTVPKPDSGDSFPVALELAEQHVGMTPMGEKLRFAGTLELAGFDSQIRWNRVAGITKGVTRVLPGLRDFEAAELWRGFRPMTPDGMPMLGRAKRYENLIIASGHNMNGVSLGPISGKIVAELVAGETPSVDLSALRPERF
ncbi:MAG: NAD(P)/FAD-dependent oxidoreductase [Thermoleophilia bacterium]